MLRDHAGPPALQPVEYDAERAGVRYVAARWSPTELARLAEHLSGEGARGLAELGRERLIEAWGDTVETLLDRDSAERRVLVEALVPLCRLSPAGLDAGLDAVLGGVRHEHAVALSRERAHTAPIAAAVNPGLPDARAAFGSEGPVAPALIVLASNLPALAVQPLLPALVVGRPVILKSPSAEPLFAPFFVRELARREPALAEAIAALTWPGGDDALEAPLLERAGVVLAYGEAESLASLERRARGRFVGFGPMTSLAVIGAEVDSARVAGGLARDIALFDQRGCLSVAAVYTAGDAQALSSELAAALARAAEELPSGPTDLATLAAVRQARAEAEMRGLWVSDLRLEVGTVILETEPSFRPTPGLRTVRVRRLASLDELPALLAPWAGRLQGAALAGEDAWGLRPKLGQLGISRFASPGTLQSPDARWHNGGVDPLAVLAPTPTS